MAYNMNSAMDVHKYYGGSGTFADRRRTWEELGLGSAAEYQGTATQNAQLVSAMNQYSGLTRPAAQPAAASSPATAGAAPSSSSAQPAAATYKSQSDELQQKLAAIAPQLTPYTGDPEAIYREYLSQKDALGPFNYDAKNDPKYQAYAAQYERNGRRAMEDTLGQVASRTGGLASSYAAAVAQQQYQRYMADLDSIIPQLEQIAYSRYRDEQSDLATEYGNRMQQEALGYSRWRDQYSDAQGLYSTAKAEEEQQYKYLADLIENGGYTPTDDELRAAGMTRDRANAYKQIFTLAQQAAAAKAKNSNSGGGGGSSSSKKDTAKDKWTILDEVSKMKGNDTAKQDKLADYYNQGVLTETEVAEIAGYLDLVEEAAVVLTDEERFLKNSPAQFLQKFGVSRFREVYGARADDYLKKLINVHL
ncbi:MAG: hypothetical protein IJL83_02280 [Clostridia bacterium]|nr:hypothetical protein [Clostridia bacterium]